jgi:hypothetical protein
MPHKPPAFGSQDYWNQRFTSNSNPFEWLEAPDVLDPYLESALEDIADPEPQLLHIGCGTSLLSYHLAGHVQSPEQIHNVDYSDVAIKIGQDRELEMLHQQAEDRNNNTPSSPENNMRRKFPMRWSSADLLSHTSLLGTCRPSSYSVIVDKSTCDSIACADDVYVPLPYQVTTTSPQICTTIRQQPLTESSEPVHPVHILAVHLALVTKPGGTWIALSYSTERFPFIDGDSSGFYDDLNDIPAKVIDSGFPNPSKLWRLRCKYEIEPPAPQMPDGTQDSALVHRPKVLHWVYVMERTDVKLHVRS